MNLKEVRDLLYSLLYSAGQMTTFTIWGAFGLVLLNQTVPLPAANIKTVATMIALGALGVGMYASHQYRKVSRE